MDLPTSLLQPFLDQAVAIRSVVKAALPDSPQPAASSPMSLGALAADARASTDATDGSDVLVISAESLLALMTPLADAFVFRAVVVLWPLGGDVQGDDDAAGLRRALFDRGLVCIAVLPFRGGMARCFLASDSIAAPGRIHADAHGRITMATLGENGRFGNQLFQYAYMRMYALRHGLTAQLPAWDGAALFQLDDPPLVNPPLARLSFAGFTDDDRALWNREDPPAEIDLHGYFQELPACWRHHRALLRRLFQLPGAQRQAIDEWRDRVTEGGLRTLVAIHVRRGDFRQMQFMQAQFRVVPAQWYLEWLRALWPTLHNPVLYVATDEPEAVRSLFDEFAPVAESFGAQAKGLPLHVREFEILRRADHLAIANSSYSRMASILAPATQQCYLPSFQARRFLPYEPWIDAAFWDRFRDTWRDPPVVANGEASGAPMVAPVQAADGGQTTASLLFDVSDLVPYLANHATMTGIQRVQCEILKQLADTPHRPALTPVVLVDGDELRAIDAAALLDLLEQVSAGTTPRGLVVSGLRVLLAQALPYTVRRRDLFLATGAFWPVRGMGRLLQRLKSAGVVIGALIHDLLPIDHPEYFQTRATHVAGKGMFEMLSFADFLITTSTYNRAALQRLMATSTFAPVPVKVVPLARASAHPAAGEPRVSPLVERILDSDYVLCVGTIEVRKNPGYLFNIWQLLLQSGRSNVPSLVFAGREGWLVRDLMDQLAACDYLDGRIVLVHDASDLELDLLYRHCRLTMFPSFAEGWGLPVGESLALGKVCLCAATGGIPDVGGPLADYIDPYNVRDGVQQLARYLDDPALLRSREREIADRFTPRSWRLVAEEFIQSALALAHDTAAGDGVAAVRMPPERYLSINHQVAASPFDGMDGVLSAEVMCTTGWYPPDVTGARARGRTSTLQFHVDAPVGATIVVVMRLVAAGRAFRLQLLPGAGVATEAKLNAGSENVVALSSRVEANQLVTIQLEADAPSATAGLFGRARHWELQGILYFEPKRLTPATMQQMLRGEQGPAAGSLMRRPSLRHPQAAPPPAGRSATLLASDHTMSERDRVPSLRDFAQASNAWCTSELTTPLAPPLFANDADLDLFTAHGADRLKSTLEGRESITFKRRNDVFVAMARFCEGSIFDRKGAWRARAYLQQVPAEHAVPWLSQRPGGLRVDGDALAGAPLIDASLLVFFNGNLHNYYHWVAEGLLSLDVLTQALGAGADVRIALPQSMEMNAVFDHRRTLDEVGLGGDRVLEVREDLARVREAIWVDSDLVERMPAHHVLAFNRRIAARYASLRSPIRRRLLVARKGPTRTVANLAQVEALLSPLGFETVYLEGLSMTEQIRLFQSADFIIGPHGAGLTNIIFCEPGTRVIEFMPVTEFRPFFWMISEKVELVHGVQFCPATDGLAFQGTLDVDIGKLGKLVDKVAAAAAAKAAAKARGTL